MTQALSYFTALKSAFNYFSGSTEQKLPKLDKVYVAAMFALFPFLDPKSHLAIRGDRIKMQLPKRVYSPSSGEEVVDLQGIERTIYGNGRDEIGVICLALREFNVEGLKQVESDIVPFAITGIRTYAEHYPSHDNAYIVLNDTADIIKSRWDEMLRLREEEQAPAHSGLYEEIHPLLERPQDYQAKAELLTHSFFNRQKKEEPK
jgi:hypothetical protein